MNIYEELFQGFIITKNKKSIEKIKGRNDFKTFNQVKDEPEFAGVLKENIALIDIDNTEMSDLLFKIVQDKKINCVVIKTGRGKHFLFKNNSITANKTKCKLAISLEADIKLGIKASYEVLKADGNLREVLLNPDELDEIQNGLYLFQLILNLSIWKQVMEETKHYSITSLHFNLLILQLKKQGNV